MSDTAHLTEAMVQADAAKAELKLTGEAFQSIRAICQKGILDKSKSFPPDTAAIQALAVKINTCDEVENALRAIIAGGDAAEQELARLRRKANLSPAQRRYADALGG